MRVPRLHKETSLFGSLSIRAAIELLRNKIALVVEDGSSATSVTVTSGMIEAVARQLVIKGVDGTTTLIEGGKLITNRLEVGKSQVTGLVTDLANAAKTATDYITIVDNTGVMVHPSGDPTTGWKISNVLEMLRAGTSVFKAYVESNKTKLRIGTTSSYVMVTSGDGVKIQPDASVTNGDIDIGNGLVGEESPTWIPGDLTPQVDYPGIVFKQGSLLLMHLLRHGPSASPTTSMYAPGNFVAGNDVGVRGDLYVNGDMKRGHIPASLVDSGTLALARGGTNSDNTAAAANKVFAGPSSGNTGSASFRSLVADDIPNLPASKVDSGTFDDDRIPNLSANKITSDALSTARGGTGRSWVAMAAGTKVVTLSNGRWASVVSASDVADLLGSGASSSNTVAIVQNGDHGACDKVFTGSIGSDGSVRGYLSENHTGSVCFNYLLVRFA